MARQGTALTPTITAWARQLDALLAEPEPVRGWFLDGLNRLPELAARAHAAGVTVLAGTDSEPHGRIADEIRRLAGRQSPPASEYSLPPASEYGLPPDGEYGLPPEAALGAGSWGARAFLGLPGLADGAPADLVAYPRDPRQDLTVLDQPSRVIIGGHLVR
jgi:hypothetical protein